MTALPPPIQTSYLEAPFSLPPLKVPAQIMARGKSEEEEECLEIFHNSPTDRHGAGVTTKVFWPRPPYLLASSREQYQISSSLLPSFPASEVRAWRAMDGCEPHPSLKPLISPSSHFLVAIPRRRAA